MKRAYKYRFYPTAEQAELLAQTFGCVRFVYNSILRWRTDAYYEQKEKIGYLQASARLTALKKESRPLPSAPSTVTITKDAAGRYFVSCLCEFEPVSLPITVSTVGIDVGLKDLFVTDTGFKQSNPRHTAKYAARLALKQESQRLEKTRQSSLKGCPTPRENCRLPDG